MAMAARQRDPQRERSWRRVLADFRASGLGVREYCRRHGLVESAFHYWRRELERRTAAVAASAFVPVTVVPGMTIEVRCPSGHVVALPSADRDTLRHLFSALASEASC
jgi:transposase-like protein